MKMYSVEESHEKCMMWTVSVAFYSQVTVLSSAAHTSTV